MAQTGIHVIATLALLGNVVLAAMALLFVGQKLFKAKGWSKLKRFVSPRSYYFVFGLSLTATLASLFLSEIVKFTPCVLCWYQRIVMYPQIILSYVAIVRNERVLTPYLIILNAIGALVAAYHYSLHLFPNALPVGCNPAIAGVSCIKGYSFYYGFMTFPYMALTVFVLNIILLLMSYNKKRR